MYSDSSHSALKYLKNTKANIQNLLIMTGGFNIQDSLWDSSFPHSSISNDLLIITDFFNLNLSILINQVPTRYSDNVNESNVKRETRTRAVALRTVVTCCDDHLSNDK